MGTKLLTTCCINKHQFDKMYYVNSPNKMHFDHKQLKFVEQHFKTAVSRMSGPTMSTCCASTESAFEIQAQKQTDCNSLTFSPAIDCENTQIDSDNMNSPQRSYNDVSELEFEKQNSTSSFDLNDEDDNLLNSIATEDDLFADEDLFEMTEPFQDEEDEPTEPKMLRKDTPYKRESAQCQRFSKLSLFKISEANEESEYTQKLFMEAADCEKLDYEQLRTQINTSNASTFRHRKSENLNNF